MSNSDAQHPVTYCSEDNSVHVTSKFVAASATLPAIEAICIEIAKADPEHNPYGLFRHPLTQVDTTLVFGTDVMCHQDTLACLIEELFVSCNYPRHIQIGTKATEPVKTTLAEQVKLHLLPRTQGGYMEEADPPSTWEWRCDAETPLSATVLASLKAAGGNIQLVTR